jgi:PAS domain S-box-containing protein
MDAASTMTVTRLVDGALELDWDDTVLDADDGAVDLLGYGADEIRGCAVVELVHNGDRRHLAAVLRRLRRVPDCRQRSLVLRFKKADGSWMSCEAPTELTGHGAERIVLGLRGIGSDHRPEALVDAIDELARRTGIAAQYDSLMVLNAEGIITVVEDRIDCALGYDAADVIGHGVWEFVHPDDLDDAAPALTREIAQPDNRAPALVVRCRYADGDWRWFEATARNRLSDPVLNGVVVALREVGPPFGERAWKQLTTAEQQVVVEVLRGLSNQEIADRRVTSVRTVEAQLGAIFTKLHLTSRAQLVRRARAR